MPPSAGPRARYADWKAPAEDGRVLLWPEPADLLRDAEDNGRVLRGAGSVLIQGASLPELRGQLRRWVGHDDDGKPTEWSLEAGSPNSLSRNGWRSNTFKAGDEVVVRLNPMKDGTPAGMFIGAKFAADGKTIGRWQ